MLNYFSKHCKIRRANLLIGCVLLTGLLTGCGQAGPLELPQTQTTQ